MTEIWGEIVIEHIENCTKAECLGPGQPAQTVQADLTNNMFCRCIDPLPNNEIL